MLPVIASVNTFNIQTPIVNTATPGNSVVHVPYDNVAPSVSSAQADNNTLANTTIVAGNADEQAAESSSDTTTTQDSGSFSSLLQGTSAPTSSGVQSTFVAQLAAQDSTPETQVVLVQYEKLVAISDVKYKPSNALKPQVEPSNVFGKILQNEKTPAPSVQHTSAQPQAAKVETPQVASPVNSNEQQVASESAAITTELPVVQPQPAQASATAQPSQSSDSATNSDTTGATTGAIILPAIPPQVIAAYASTASRINSFNVAVGESV